MADGDDQRPSMSAYAERLMECIQQFTDAFPDYSCLRCGATDFSARYDQTTWPVRDGDEFYEVIENVCQRCGKIERHQMGPLRQACENGDLPLRPSVE